LKTHFGKTFKKVLKNYPIMKILKNSFWKNIQKCLKKKELLFRSYNARRDSLITENKSILAGSNRFQTPEIEVFVATNFFI